MLIFALDILIVAVATIYRVATGRTLWFVEAYDADEH
jgi:hypothetical protein